MTTHTSKSRIAGSRAYRWGIVAVVLGICAGLFGCSGEYYRKSADRDAYAIVAQKTPKVPGMEKSFSLAPVLAGNAAKQLAPARRISLAEAITIARAFNHDYQTQREGVYLQALDLAYQRYLWRPIFSGILNAAWSSSEPSEDRSVTGNSTFSVNQLLWTGGDMSLTLATNFMRFLSGAPRETASSLLSFAATQHLWRGAGVSIAMENLTQAERSMVYAIRSFVRYERQFDVSIASSYYDVLHQRDTVANQLLNMNALTDARKRAQMMAEAGRMADFEVASAQQDELTAKDYWISTTQAYERKLDAFKIQLGLSIDTPLELDPSELSMLGAQELPKVNHTQQEATDLALRCRLDLATSGDSVVDAERKVKVARDNLNPSVDLVLNAAIGTQAPDKAFSFTKENSSYGYGVNVQLPLNQMQQRNAYRASLITLDQQKRARDLTRDQVRLDISNDWRNLDQARQSYEIQKLSVQLAERRVDNTQMLVEAQRATMRDLLDATSSLLASRNNLTSALVSYTITLLQLWRDMEALEFKDGQFIEEIPRDDKRNG